MLRDFCNLKQKLKRDFTLFTHPTEKSGRKKKGCILALDSKTCWGSVFNLEDKTICPTGVGVFVGHRNKLSSTEDISKSNCPRLSKVREQLGDTGGVRANSQQWEQTWGAGMEVWGRYTDGAGVSRPNRILQSWRKALVKDCQSHFIE